MPTNYRQVLPLYILMRKQTSLLIQIVIESRRTTLVLYIIQFNRSKLSQITSYNRKEIMKYNNTKQGLPKWLQQNK